jgi:hypothetical protein
MHSLFQFKRAVIEVGIEPQAKESFRSLLFVQAYKYAPEPIDS